MQSVLRVPYGASGIERVNIILVTNIYYCFHQAKSLFLFKFEVSTICEKSALFSLDKSRNYSEGVSKDIFASTLKKRLNMILLLKLSEKVCSTYSKA